MSHEPTLPDGAVSPISVTVIGGYLGAGKTTLVNSILHTSDERMAVIVNDFGDIGIDADLIEQHDGTTISLQNGCVCCTMADGLAAALAAIADLSPRPERLVIEASGVADPAGVAAYAHAPGMRLDAVVVVADAESIRETTKDRYVGDLVRRQLEAADLIVLNKVDLVETALAAEIRAWIETINDSGIVVDAEQAWVPRELLFGIPQAGSHTTTSSAEAVNFSTRTLTSDSPVTRDDLEQLLSALPPSTVRVKGFVWLAERSDRAMILQAVGRRWSLIAGPAWSGEPATGLVVIDAGPAGPLPPLSDSFTVRTGSPPSR